MKVYDVRQRVFEVKATFADFDGGLEKWKESFYELWRYQLTWEFAYRFDLKENRNGVYVDMLIRKAYRNNVLDAMEALGYRNVMVTEEAVGIIDGFDHDELDDVDDVFIDW